MRMPIRIDLARISWILFVLLLLAAIADCAGVPGRKLSAVPEIAPGIPAIAQDTITGMRSK